MAAAGDPAGAGAAGRLGQRRAHHDHGAERAAVPRDRGPHGGGSARGGAGRPAGMALDAARTGALRVSAAATGLFALHWHCTDGSASHLMLYHALPWLALALLAIPLRRALPTENHVP